MTNAPSTGRRRNLSAVARVRHMDGGDVTHSPKKRIRRSESADDRAGTSDNEKLRAFCSLSLSIGGPASRISAKSMRFRSEDNRRSSNISFAAFLASIIAGKPKHLAVPRRIGRSIRMLLQVNAARRVFSFSSLLRSYALAVVSQNNARSC